MKELADRVTVFRDGENAGDLEREEINHDAMVRLMVAEDLNEFYDRKMHQPGKLVLRTNEIISPTYPEHSISIEVKEGEIVGIAWISRSGKNGTSTNYFWNHSGTRRGDGNGGSTFSLNHLRRQYHPVSLLLLRTGNFMDWFFLCPYGKILLCPV